MLTIQPMELPSKDPHAPAAPAWLAAPQPVVLPAFVERPAAPAAPAAAPEVPAVDPQLLAEAELQRELAAARAEAERAGRAVGEAAGRAEWETRVARLDAILAELSVERQQTLAGLEDQLCELSVAIAKALVGDLFHDEQVIGGLVREGLELLGEAEQIQIRVAPVDLEVVQRQVAALGEQGARLRVVADGQLSQGCLLDSALAQIDASVDGRLARVRDALLAGGAQ